MPKLKNQAQRAELFERDSATWDRIAPGRDSYAAYEGVKLFALLRADEMTADEEAMIRAVASGDASHPVLSNPFIVMQLAWELDGARAAGYLI